MHLTPEQKKRLTWIVVLGAAGLGLIAYYWFISGKPAIAAAAEAKKDLSAKIAVLQKDLATIQEFKQIKARGEWKAIEGRIEEASRRLPQTRRPEEFHKALRDILRTTGISTRKLSTDEVAEYDRFAEIPYSIEATGRFHEFGSFLNLVEENPDRFMRLKTLKITNDLKRPSLHPIEVGIATFMLKN